ncbi:MAG: permease [Bacillota bacterium]|nr:permease [Bacillota bacterium]MDD3851696.1 permease [Bacillota bacterium]MDD4708331.1 permease [Bacillota bacterium]
MFEILLYAAAVSLLGLSYYKDREKTKKGLKKAWKSFLNVFPAFAGVLALTGLALSIISPDFISRFIGNSTGFLGMLTTAVIGAITLIPGFIAFPLAASLLEKGAGITQMAVFVSTLMMVGIVTMPLEIQYFGRKEALLRNAFSFLFSFIVAAVIGVVVS